MSDTTQHQSPFEDGHTTWVDGVTCTDCQDLFRKKRELLNNGSPAMNIHRLKADNAGGYTQAELGREVQEAAKRDGREIERYR
jgi:hypothetical protein